MSNTDHVYEVRLGVTTEMTYQFKVSILGNFLPLYMDKLDVHCTSYSQLSLDVNEINSKKSHINSLHTIQSSKDSQERSLLKTFGKRRKSW